MPPRRGACCVRPEPPNQRCKPCVPQRSVAIRRRHGTVPAAALLALGLLAAGRAAAATGSAVSAPDTLDSRPPLVAVLHPAGGETLQAAAQETLRWSVDETSWGAAPAAITVTVFDGAEVLVQALVAARPGRPVRLDLDRARPRDGRGRAGEWRPWTASAGSAPTMATAFTIEGGGTATPPTADGRPSRPGASQPLQSRDHRGLQPARRGRDRAGGLRRARPRDGHPRRTATGRPAATPRPGTGAARTVGPPRAAPTSRA